MDKNVNLEEISKMPNKEFQQHFQEWLERDDVARSLQAKLRKDLIDNFNKTSLGKKMYSQHIKSQRMILSPLILAINALVAEFLYAQNCHFSLSVFCTEVPYRNTMPDFESGKNFRFNETELTEILEAVSINFDKTLKIEISNQYLKMSNQRISLSLLHIILKTLFKPIRADEVKEIDDKPIVPPPNCKNCEEKSVKIEMKPELFNMNFRYLNKYLMILSRKVKEMSNSLDQLEKREINQHKAGRRSVECRKLGNLNRSLDKVSETLRQLSFSRRKNKTIASIVTSIDSMSKQFEKCAENFKNVADGYKNQHSFKSRYCEKSYADWVLELRSSENGRKFMDKIESAMKKTLYKEKTRIEQAYNSKLETQKDLIKLKYKQKLFKQMNSKEEETHNHDEMSKRINSGIEKKIKEFEQRHQEVLLRIQQAEAKVQMVPESIQSKVLTNIQAEGIPKQDQNKCKENQCEKINNSLPKYSPPITDKNPRDQLQKPQINLQEMVKSIAAQERHIDHIVFDAKLRIQELEFESNQIDRNFHEYLERQKTQKHQMEETATSIWKNYTIGKSMLNEKCKTLRHNSNNAMRKQSEGIVTKFSKNVIATERDNCISDVGDHFFGLNLNVPKIVIDNEGEDNNHNDFPVIIEESIEFFANPYKQLKEEFLNKKSWKKVNQKPNTNVDDESDESNKNTLLPVTLSLKTKGDTKHSLRNNKNRKQQYLKPPSIRTKTKQNLSPKPSSGGISSELNIDSSIDDIDFSHPKSGCNKSEVNIEINSDEHKLENNSDLNDESSHKFKKSINLNEQIDDYGLSQFILDNAQKKQNGKNSKVDAFNGNIPKETLIDINKNSTKTIEVQHVEELTTKETQEDDNYIHKDYNNDNNNQNFQMSSFSMPKDKSASDGSSSTSSLLELSTGKYTKDINSGESDFWN